MDMVRRSNGTRTALHTLDNGLHYHQGTVVVSPVIGLFPGKILPASPAESPGASPTALMAPTDHLTHCPTWRLTPGPTVAPTSIALLVTGHVWPPGPGGHESHSPWQPSASTHTCRTPSGYNYIRRQSCALIWRTIYIPIYGSPTIGQW